MEIIGIDRDIPNILRRILELVKSGQDSIAVTLHSAFFKGHPHDIAYRNPNSVPKIIEMGLASLVRAGKERRASGLQIQEFEYYELNFNINRVKEFLSSGEPSKDSLPQQIVEKGVDKEFAIGKLKVNISQGTLQYANNKPFEVSFERKEIVLLISLYEKERVVQYYELAKRLSYTYHEDYDKVTNRSISQVKRDLQDLLIEKCGMPKREAKSLIVSKRMIGYKLIRNYNLT